MSSSLARAISHVYGDSGLLVDLVADEYEARWLAAHMLSTVLRLNPPSGLVDVVASFQAVFVSFDPLVTDHDHVRAAVEQALDQESERPASRRFEVPVVYGGESGPCLEAVAYLCDLSPAEVLELHSAEDWVVRVVGSPAGAPLMDGPRFPRSIPRLVTPRARMEPGSVAVSGFQSIIYNAPSPGGWQVLGRSPAVLFDLTEPPHVPYRPGDRIRFRPISREAWDEWCRPLRQVCG